MLGAELKQRATELVQPPISYQLVIEEYGEEEVMFSWSNEEQDEGMIIVLESTGNLTRLSIEKNNKNPEMIPLNAETRKEIAEQFLLSHYPNALKELTFYKTKKLTHAVRFYYEQIVMELPLDQAGCYIDIDSAEDVVEFTYKGIKEIPEVPTKLISKDNLIEHVKSELDFRLTITNLYTSIHDVDENGLYLVYEPKQYFMKYKADVLKPTLTIIHDEDIPQTCVSLMPSSGENVNKDLPIEEIVGITEKMEVIREVDMGEEKGIVWRDRDWEMEGKDTSIYGFLKSRSEDTVKAVISKKTGKIKSFVWFKERNGNFQLSREECYHKTLDFLHKIVPEYYQYLKLIVQENEEEDHDTSINESFTFHMYKGDDIPIQLEMVMVVVNRVTGQIDHYNGPSFDMEELSQIAVKPAISKKEAKEIFLNHLDFELEWNKDYDSEIDSYNLVYQACDRHSRTSIRYIDAMSGAVISDKDQ